MAEQISGTNEAQGNQMESDPWAAAFAALEPKSAEADSSDADTGNNVGGSDSLDANSADGEVISEAGSGNDDADEASSGGLDTSSGANLDENGGSSVSAFSENLGVTEESIEKFEEELNNDLRNQAIDAIAKEFIKRGIRNRNGVLGASLDDNDICKRDEDGVPHFYNPETGREFTGENPRRQAQEWCDDYNNELSRVFNNACQQYEDHLRKESAPKLAVMKFAPKYEKLDDIRKGMFDNVIQDYEITDNSGKVIGYSCDLDKALAMVDRQINMIQTYAKQHQQQQVDNKPTGPALDMKTSSGAVQTGSDNPPTSLAEAMERLQDIQINKLKNN